MPNLAVGSEGTSDVLAAAIVQSNGVRNVDLQIVPRDFMIRNRIDRPYEFDTWVTMTPDEALELAKALHDAAIRARNGRYY